MNVIDIQSSSLEELRSLEIIEDDLKPMVHQVKGGDVPSRYGALGPWSGSVPHTGTKFEKPSGRTELANSKDLIAGICRLVSQAFINLTVAR